MKEKKANIARVLYFEAFYGGSHKYFADSFIQHSHYNIDLETLPDRSWKNRMRCASMELSQRVQQPENYSAVISGGMMSIQDLRSLWGQSCPPVLLYAHETHLSYPAHPNEKHMYEFYRNDIGNMLSADLILFNSKSHLQRFLAAGDNFLQQLKSGLVLSELIRDKVHVVYPGCFHPGQAPYSPHTRDPGPLRILWNHRWEFDKRPEDFFSLLVRLHRAGMSFELILLGEDPWPNADIASGRHNQAMIDICRNFGDAILHQGYLSERKDYYSWLEKADIVISTSVQENFGLSITEAIYHGCIPLLPERLSYPELIPGDFHKNCLYTDLDEAFAKFLFYCQRAEDGGELTDPKLIEQLSLSMRPFSWESQAKAIDSHISALV